MIGFRLKYLSFDSPAVIAKVKPAKRKVLSRFGAFVRRTAKSSIRKRKKTSTPGSPPSSHTGLLKKFILFGYDPGKDSVVIGAKRLGGRGKGDVPSLLEYGGTTMLVRRGKRELATYQARPYMGPAYDKEEPKLPAMWRDSVK